jgi:hypothetical protein
LLKHHVVPKGVTKSKHLGWQWGWRRRWGSDCRHGKCSAQQRHHASRGGSDDLSVMADIVRDITKMIDDVKINLKCVAGRVPCLQRLRTRCDQLPLPISIHSVTCSSNLELSVHL